MTQSLVKNFFSLVGAEAFGKLITFAAFAYLARRLGAANFGYIEWAAAVLMCASLIVDQGFNAYGAREIAKKPLQTAALIAQIVTARLFLAAFGYAAVALFALFFVTESLIINLLLIYGLSLWTLPFLLQWVFQGHDRMYLVSWTQIIRQTIFVGIVFAFVRGAEDLLFVGAAETISVTCAALFSVVMFRHKFPEYKLSRPTFSAKLFREGAPIGLSQIFWTVKMFGATLILGLFATAEDTGIFAAAMRIFIALHVFVWFYYFNLSPSLARAWEQGSEKFSELIGNSMRIVLPVALAAGIIWVLIAPTVMTIVYGNNFAKGGATLQWLAGAFVAAAISGHYRFGLIAGNFQSGEMLTSALGAVLAAILIPIGYFNFGTSGAAAALCFGEISVLIFAWLIARRTLFNLSPETCLKSWSEATR
jgi:O-antigen/teichoic acid export membrane protein